MFGTVRREMDWLRQAEADLKAARDLKATSNFAHACFMSQQAAKKALKAALERLGEDTFGHDLDDLLGRVERHVSAPEGVRRACAKLNKFYIPTRYPNAFPSGAPSDHFHEFEAEEAIRDANCVLSFARGIVLPAGE